MNLESSTLSSEQSNKSWSKLQINQIGFIKNKTLEISLLALLGPFFSFITLLFLSQNNITGFGYFFCISCSMLILSYKFKNRALLVGLTAYVLASFVSFNNSTSLEKMWLLGSLCSLMLSHYITILGSHELASCLQKLEDDLEKVQSQLVKFEEQVQDKENSWNLEWESLLVELERWKEQAEQRLIEKGQVEQLLKLSRQEVSFLSQQKQKLLEEVETIRKSIYETLQINEDLKQRLLAIPAPKEETFISLDQIKDRSQSHIESLYKQLKAQFEEKCQVLSQTRIDLFRAEGQTHSLQIKQEQDNLDLSWNEFQFFQGIISLIQVEKQALENEVLELEKIIQSLLPL